MKIFKFIVSKIFLRKAILGIGIMLLLLMANYITFTAARSILSTFQGYQETKYVNQEGVYIASLDPNSHIDMSIVGENETQAVYNYLNSSFKYAFYTDGFIVSVPNGDDMKISLGYLNEQYYRLNEFELSQGTDLGFDYQLDGEIPVLIGKGLSKTYPVGATIELEESVLGWPLTLKVQGVLKQNACHSNFYALNSKAYYNFSILFPVNEKFINHANMDIKFNGLMDIILLDTSEEEIADLSEVIKDNLGLRFNFFSQKENYPYRLAASHSYSKSWSVNIFAEQSWAAFISDSFTSSSAAPFSRRTSLMSRIISCCISMLSVSPALSPLAGTSGAAEADPTVSVTLPRSPALLEAVISAVPTVLATATQKVSACSTATVSGSLEVTV